MKLFKKMIDVYRRPSPSLMVSSCSGLFHSPPTLMCTGPCVPPLRQLLMLAMEVASKQLWYAPQDTTFVKS